MHVSTTLLPSTNQQTYNPLPPYYYNQTLPNQINFIEFSHFQSQPFTKHPFPPSSYPSFPSSENFTCKQENQVNIQNTDLPLVQSYPLTRENIKNEQTIQAKCEDDSIHGFLPENHNFPLKFEVKKEDDQHSSSIQFRSKKISKSSPAKTEASMNIKEYQKKTRRTWSPEEDLQVLELVKKYGTKWAKIASFMKSRNGKQVRDHYLNALVPDINRGVWTEEEDKAILFYYKKFGAQWCRIAECLDGRTETQVKGRFYTNLKQKLMTKNSNNTKVEIVIDENVKEEEEF